MDLIANSSENGVNENRTVYLSEVDIIRIPEKDLAVLCLKSLPPRRGLSRFLPKEDIDVKHNGHYIGRSLDGKVECRSMGPVVKYRNLYLKPLKISTDTLACKGKEPTRDGDCGTCLFLQTPKGYVLYGFHSMIATAGEALSLCITLKDFAEILKNVKMCVPGEPLLSAPSAPQELGSLHHKSVFRYIEDGTANVYGSLKGFRQAPKSRVADTPMSKYLVDEGYTTKYTRPVMKGWEPWRIAAKDMVATATRIDSTVLEVCKHAYMRDIIKSSCKHDFEDLFVLDDFTTVNGAPGVKSIDKMKRNTSAGFPFKRSKKFFLKLVPPEHGVQDPVEVSQEILDRSEAMIEAYLRGERAHPIFTAHLKDEAVSFSKAKRKKTRVFTGAPMDWSLVVRKFYLSAVRVIQNNRLAFETAVGTTAQSREWEGLYKYVTRQSEENVVAGDFGAFDKKMPPQFILAAFEILIEMCSLSGNFEEKDFQIMWGIAIDTAFPTVDFNGDLVEFYGSNPSGHPLTVIINSLVNSLYMRYVFVMLSPHVPVTQFQDFVSLLTYGDDNIMSVSSETPWFNHTAIANVFADMGIKYTMADKDAESVPYIHIIEASFLKRTWLWNEELNCHLAPLDHDSIEKSLMVWVASPVIGEEQQCIAIIASAIREYFQYGREEFEARTKLLKELVRKMNLDIWVEASTFPSWKTLVEEYDKTSLAIAYSEHDRSKCSLK